VYLGTEAERKVSAEGPAAAELLAHELVHVRQYHRLGAAAFLGYYVGEYLRGRLAGASHAEAYRAISFEREAEAAASDFRNEAG
jgi:Domain of unknown function (DUF4157)